MVTPHRVIKIDHLSYSYLHVFTTCPYQAFLKYEAGLRGPSTPWITLGNAIHYALETTHSEGDWDIAKALRLFHDEYYRIMEEEEVFVSYPLLKKLDAEGTEMLELYNGQILAGQIPQDPLVVEQEFKILYREGLDIVGRIDKIETEVSATGVVDYIVTDYKTGKNKPDEWLLAHDMQFTMYAWACLKLYGKLPKKLYYHHLRSGDRMETTRTMDDINELIITIDNILDMKDKDIRYRVYNERACGQCDFAGKICDDRELEKEVVEGLAKLGR